jgi:hypothetical protein
MYYNISIIGNMDVVDHNNYGFEFDMVANAYDIYMINHTHMSTIPLI